MKKRIVRALFGFLLAMLPLVTIAEEACKVIVVVDGDKKTIYILKSCDPNEIKGPEGVGEARLVKPGDVMDYTIYFENVSNATAAAQEVRVTLPKDPGLDWSTLEFGEVAFGENIDLGLATRKESEYRLPGSDCSVKTVVKVTDTTVEWYLRSWDPNTPDNFPANIADGFLPPNDETGRGEGHLRFRVKVKENAAPQSVIRASASIVFDTNDPIETDPAWWNTVAEVRSLTLSLGDEMTTNLTLLAGIPFGELPVPTRTGYAFKGWFFGPDGTGGEVTADTLVPSGLERVYPAWEAKEINVWIDGVKHIRRYDDVANYESLLSVTNGYTNVVCVGWIGTGDVPAAGTGNSVTFTVTQESTLRWLYETNYWVSATAVGPRGAQTLPAGGNVTLKDAAGVALPTNELWSAAGTMLTAEATANEGWAFARWVDVETGAEFAQRGALTLPVNRPQLVRAEFTNLMFTVRFGLGEHGSRVGGGELEQAVAWGGSATAPFVRADDGFAFAGWSADFDRIVGDLVVTARWERIGNDDPEPEPPPTLFFAPVGGGLNPKGATYNGFVGDESLSGSFTIAVKKPKNGASSAAATLTLTDAATGKKRKLVGTVDVGTGVCTGSLSGLTLGASGVFGTLDGASVQGAVDATKAKDAAVLSVMNEYNKRSYGAVFSDANGAQTMLTVVFAAKGKAKISGTVAGKKISGSAQMSVGDMHCAVPFVYAKKTAAVSCVFWFERQSRRLVAVTGCGGRLEPLAFGSSDVPASGVYGFELSASDVLASVPDAVAETPLTMTARFNGKKFDAGKAGKVTYKNGVLNVRPGDGGNVAGLTVKYVKGTLTGAFTVYAVTNGRLMKNKFTISGLMIDGNGQAVATNKKLKPIPVGVRRF